MYYSGYLAAMGNRIRRWNTQLRYYASEIYRSFTVKLLLNHLRKNQLLLLCWLFLFALVTGNFAKALGAMYLFLDPEYLDKVDFVGYCVVGVSLGFFTMSFHVTSYILDSFRFSFLGALRLPFLKFTLNNALIPLLFMGVYTFYIVHYQLDNEFVKPWQISLYVAGLWLGFLVTLLLLFAYFVWNNQHIFQQLVQRVDQSLRKAPVSRANVMHRLEIARKKKIRVDNYLELSFQPTKVPSTSHLVDKQAIVRVFDQHQFNLLTVEIFILLVLIIMGFFGEYTAFQLPAAASVILLLTVFLMLIGAISWWFREWAFSVGILLLFGVNLLATSPYFQKGSFAYGLDYQAPPALYNETQIKLQHSDTHYETDFRQTLTMLRNWRNKFAIEGKPPLVLICTSGGGQRAAMWAVRALQIADSLTQGKLMQHTALITGASGGAIGAAYYRELLWRSLRDTTVVPHHEKFLASISHDHLNSVIFNFLANDLFIGKRKIYYDGIAYASDRGYAFEQRLNTNTFQFLDKPISDYREAEMKAQIPMLLLTPTIINDGRKLYIASHPVSYMTRSYDPTQQLTDNPWKGHITGIDFQRFFKAQRAEQLRFLSALRMNATFPYVTPNVMLPSQPALEIMDAGIIDNFGVSDALRFLYTFREWIERNTSEVILLSIRDTQVGEGMSEPPTAEPRSLFHQLFRPIEGFYENFGNIQDFYHQEKLTFAEEWFEGNLSVLTLEYQPGYLLYEQMHRRDFTGTPSPSTEVQRASLSWRLTGKEKHSILESIYSGHNRNTLNQLRQRLRIKKETF